MKVLRIKPLGEGNDFAGFDSYSTETMDATFDIVLEVAIVDGVRKSHGSNPIGMTYSLKEQPTQPRLSARRSLFCALLERHEAAAVLDGDRHYPLPIVLRSS